MRHWIPKHFDFAGYVIGEHPSTFGPRAELRESLGYRSGERVCIVAVGGFALMSQFPMFHMIGWGLARRLSFSRQQRLDLPHDRLALIEPRLQIRLVAMLVPVKETVARGPEPVPDHLGLDLAHGTGGLPFGLQPLQRAAGHLPVGRFGQRLGLVAEGFLLRQISGPLILLLLQVFLTPREERVA